MDFTDLLRLIPKIINVPLPGEAAHFKLAPPERKDLIKNLDVASMNPRRAAVLMLIYPKNDKAYLALIRRNSYKGVHSSQIAFPGGKIEANETPRSAAIRETEEEIGISGSDLTVICAFSEVYIPPSNFCVSPFLAVAGNSPNFIPDPREVAEIVEFPLSEFLDDSFISYERMATSYSASIDVPSFRVGSNAVWGATAMMMSELKEVINSVL